MTTLRLTVLLLLQLLALTMASAANIPCHQPSADQLHSQWTDYIRDDSMHGHESYFSVETFRATIKDQLDTDNRSEEIYHLDGNQDNSLCSINNIEGQAALQNRSSCPWYHVISNSTDRYPRDLAEARCRCPYGADMGAESACELVYYSIRVLKRTDTRDEDGYCVYTPGWQRISVGCTMTKV